MNELFTFKGRATSKTYWHVVGIGGVALLLLTAALFYVEFFCSFNDFKNI